MSALDLTIPFYALSDILTDRAPQQMFPDVNVDEKMSAPELSFVTEEEMDAVLKFQCSLSSMAENMKKSSVKSDKVQQVRKKKVDKRRKKTKMFWKCEFCDYGTNMKHNLMRHAKAWHSDRPFAMPEPVPNLPLSKFDKPKILWNCEFCTYKTNIKSHLKRHSERKHPEHPFTSPKMTTYDGSELEWLELWNKKELKRRGRFLYNESLQSWHCEMCNFVTKYNKNLHRHISSLHPGHSITPPISDAVQESTTARPQFSAVHEIASERVGLHSAFSSVANQVLKRQQKQLKKLKSKYNSFKMEKLQCNFCEYETNYSSNLQRHTKRHCPGNSAIVPMGEFRGDIKSELNPPQLSIICEATEVEMTGSCSLPSEDEPPLKRKQSPVKAKRKRKKLQNRNKREIATLLWQCNFCDYATNDKYNFRRHAKRHDRTDLFSPPVVTYDGDSETNSTYISIGSGTSEIGMSVSSSFSSEDEQNGKEKPPREFNKTSTVLWQCNFCEYVTSDKSNFNVHAKRHEPTDPLQSNSSIDEDSVSSVPQLSTVPEDRVVRMSPQLPFLITKEDDLDINEESQIMEFEMNPQPSKTFQCPYCDFGTKYYRNLNRHIRSLHPESTPPEMHGKSEDGLQPSSPQFPYILETVEEMNPFQHENHSTPLHDVSDEIPDWNSSNLPISPEKREISNAAQFLESPPFPPVYDISEDDSDWLPAQLPIVEKTKVAKAVEFPLVEKCPHCDYQLPRSRAYRMPIHLLVVHNSGPRQYLHCSFCSYKTPIQHQLNRHMNVHFNEQATHECQFCGYMAQEITLRRHLKTEHQYSETPVLLCCEICNYKSYEQWRVNRHRRNRHKLEPIFFCTKCQSNFPSRHARKNHLCTPANNSCIAAPQNLNSSVYQDMPCLTPQSLLDINDNNSVTSESQTKESENGGTRKGNSNIFFECKRCGEKYSHEGDLSDHIKLKHSQAEKKKIFEVTNENQCNLCFVTCWNAQALVNHLKRHK